MNTKLFVIQDKNNIEDTLLMEAARVLREGGLVAFPTETVYGLGANALDAEAAGKIYAAKGRPSDNPLIAHIAGREELGSLVSHIPEAGEILMDKFWPGPLTLVFPKSDLVPYKTTGGLETVAVRMPSDPIANRLIALAGVPVAAPSANTSGRPSPTTAAHVFQDMNGRIDVIVDGGAVGIGLESTIVDVSGEVPVLLRPGAITCEMLEAVLGTVEIDPTITGPLTADVKPKAPGMKYKHYAPKARLMLVEGETDKVIGEINRLVAAALAEDMKPGVICTEETYAHISGGVIKCIGKRGEAGTIAHNLYAVLREFDDLDVEVIYSESFSCHQLGQAIMNRLMKAAGYQIVHI